MDSKGYILHTPSVWAPSPVLSLYVVLVCIFKCGLFTFGMHYPSLQPIDGGVLMYGRTFCCEMWLVVRGNVQRDELYDLKCVLAPKMVELAKLMHDEDWSVYLSLASCQDSVSVNPLVLTALHYDIWGIYVPTHDDKWPPYVFHG